MSLAAGRLRHRISLQMQVTTKDPDSGEQVSTWVEFAKAWAAIEPLSVREFMAAQATQSQITARIVMRHRDDLLPTMRIVHGVKRYDVAGFLPDKDSGLEYVTVPVVEVLSGSEDPPLHVVLDGGQL